MSKWTKYVTKMYSERKGGNPNYTFKYALKDAAKTYKNRGKPEPVVAEKKNKTRTMKNKSRKNRGKN